MYSTVGSYEPLFTRVPRRVVYCEVHTIPIDSLSLFSESPAIVCFFRARRLSRHSHPFFPEPRKGAYPYLRGHSSSGLFLAHCAEGGHRGSLIHRSTRKRSSPNFA